VCTIITVSRDAYNVEVESQIWQDARVNSDGWSLLLIDASGVATVMKTMSLDHVYAVLDYGMWARMFLHARMATQGGPVLENCHGWSQDGVFYMHNGILQNPEAWNYEVDSQLIGQWLDEGGVPNAVDELAREPYANVFLVDSLMHNYTVARSSIGSLYTDDNGNYSSNEVGDICLPVPEGFVQFHSLRNEQRRLGEVV